MKNDDQEFSSLLRSLERPREPGPAADARVEARMFSALAQSSVDGPGTGERDGAQRLWRPAHSVLLVAATIVAMVVGLALVARSPEPEPPALGGSTLSTLVPTASTPEPPAVASTSAPITSSASALPPNVLGYQPFTSVGFSIGPPGAAPESGAVLERVGDVSASPDGFVTSVRRVIGPDITDFDLVIRGDGSALVPIEYIDPPSFGGRCTGGVVVLTVDSTETQSTEARCSGRTTTVRIDTAIGTAQPDGAADATMLLPVTYTIDIDGSTGTRAVTLWHDGDDLARLEPAETPTDPPSQTTDDTNTEETP